MSFKMSRGSSNQNSEEKGSAFQRSSLTNLEQQSRMPKSKSMYSKKR